MGPFLGEKTPAATYPQVMGFQKSGVSFSGKKAPAASYPQVRGFQKYGGRFSGEKKSACVGASKNMGAPFSGETKAPAAMYPQVRGLVPRSWYKDLRRAREAEPLGMQDGTGGCKCCRPLAKGSGGLEAPQEQQGVWGAAAPQ